MGSDDSDGKSAGDNQSSTGSAGLGSTSSGVGPGGAAPQYGGGNVPPPRKRRNVGCWIFGALGLLVIAVMLYMGMQSREYAESKPRPGQTTRFTMDELRYCKAEEIRLLAARDVVSGTEAIQNFIAATQDFLSRCQRFTYDPREMPLVDEQINARRAQLEQEGRARFGGGAAGNANGGAK